MPAVTFGDDCAASRACLTAVTAGASAKGKGVVPWEGGVAVFADCTDALMGGADALG